LAADADARALLADAIARIETNLFVDRQHHETLQLAATAAVERLRHSFDDHATDVAGALERIAASYELLADRVDAERIERRALVDALTALALPPQSTPSPLEPRVLGGSFFASSGGSNDIDIDLAIDPGNERTNSAHSTEDSMPEAPLVVVDDRLSHWSKS
jgi:hypothetical protein